VSGVVVAVCIGPGGIPKTPVGSARAERAGPRGDRHRNRHHGCERRAVSVLSLADYRALREDGVRDAGPGTYGENLLLDGLDLADARPGDRLEVGPEAVLVLEDVRLPCGVLCSVDPRFPDLMTGRSGWLCSVERPGELAPEQGVRLVPALP